jgi:hypothetical protein
VTLHRYYSYDLMPELWNALEELFATNRLISHRIVFDEITRAPDALAYWISSRKKYFLPVSYRQTELVSRILALFPGLIDIDKEIDQADPWVIALAIEKRENPTLLDDHSGLTVVTAESERAPVSMPAVCQEFGVPHMNLKEFFTENGWKLRIEKSEVWD